MIEIDMNSQGSPCNRKFKMKCIVQGEGRTEFVNLSRTNQAQAINIFYFVWQISILFQNMPGVCCAVCSSLVTEKVSLSKVWLY